MWSIWFIEHDILAQIVISGQKLQFTKLKQSHYMMSTRLDVVRFDFTTNIAIIHNLQFYNCSLSFF